MYDLRVTQYSHYFAVFGYTAKGRVFRKAFTEQFIETALVRKRGRFFTEPKKVYVRRDIKKDDRCYHITTLEQFKAEAALADVTIEWHTVPMYTPVSVEFTDSIAPWDNQLAIIEHAKSEGIQKAITAEPGFGKAAPLSSKVRVPGGWTTMGEIKVGDITVNRSGRPQRVSGVFPQGITEVWRVHFEDGRYTDVNPEHLWEVGFSKPITTRELKDRWLSRRTVSVPLVSGFDLSEEEKVDFESFDLKPGRFQRSTQSKEEALRLQYVIRAVGGVARIWECDGTTVDFEFGIDPYRRLTVVSVEDRPAEHTQCIMVDDPEHLYVTDDFIVTHNTLCTIKAVSDIGQRFAVVTLGGYEDRWVPEFHKLLGLKPEEIRSCCGCTKLYRLIREVRTTGIPKVKAIFISTNTLQAFYKNWENGKVQGSGCEDVDPATLWELLGVGVCAIDEAHKHFHINFISDLYSHIPKKIYLTATLYPSTEFIGKMYEVMIPSRIRKAGDKVNVYLDLYKVNYRLKEPNRARFIGGQGSYSHTTYESWISSDSKREQRYINAIFVHAMENWFPTRRDEHKLLIFAATIEMCRKLAAFFKIRKPQLVINSYTSGDDYQLLLDSDIIFSTIGKSGTAVDIPNLTQAYLTVAIDSPNANIQAAGRPRELKGDKKFPQSFHCFVCEDIDKHVDYWKSKERLFKGRVKGITTTYLTEVI